MATIASVVPSTVTGGGGETTFYPQCLGVLVLEDAAVFKLYDGAVFYVRPSTSSTEEMRVKSSSTVEIKI